MIRITRAGLFYVVITILVGVSAVNTANNLIYVVASLLLGFMLVSGIAGRANLHAVRVTIRFPEEIYAETPTPVQIRIKNPRRFLPVFLVHVRIADHSCLFPYLDPQGSEDRWIHVTFRRRGRIRVPPTIISSNFPFHFFTRYRIVAESRELVVFPRLLRCPFPALPARPVPPAFRGTTDSHKTGEDPDFLGIREYQPGDPLKRIHWKSSAKTGRLLSKEYVSAVGEKIILDLKDLPEKEPERRISCAAFWVVTLMRRGIAVGLVLGNTRHPPKNHRAHRRKLLTALALHGQG